MTENPREDVVARQYQKWQYPEPIQDLTQWVASDWQLFDPSHAHRLLWPNEAYRPIMDILIAGCGTNQAAVFAYNNRDARVVAVDISEPSLAHQRFLKEKHQLDNLELHLLPVEEVPSLGLDFDLIVSTGVLHHLADPDAGAKALASCLRRDGAMALMLYAKYGRAGVEQLQAVFRDLGLQQDEAGVAMVKQALAALPAEHPVQAYRRITRDLNFDAGIVDTFLHGRDRSYTVDDCLAMLDSAGLVFQTWYNNAPYYPHYLDGNGVSQFSLAIEALPDPAKWATMERLRTVNACHYFIACRADRDSDSYRIDFTGENALDFVPVMRMRCGMTATSIFRPGWQLPLDPRALAFAQRVDGIRSIREIAAECAGGSATPEFLDFSRALFHALWRLDFVAMTRVSGDA